MTMGAAIEATRQCVTELEEPNRTFASRTVHPAAIGS